MTDYTAQSRVTLLRAAHDVSERTAALTQGVCLETWDFKEILNIFNTSLLTYYTCVPRICYSNHVLYFKLGTQYFSKVLVCFGGEIHENKVLDVAIGRDFIVKPPTVLGRMPVFISTVTPRSSLIRKKRTMQLWGFNISGEFERETWKSSVLL